MPAVTLLPASGADRGGDLDSPLKYVRLAAEVRGWVESGRHGPGARLSAAVLTAERGLSRPTCARALRMLEGEGLLKRYPGAGYVVLRAAGDRK